MSSPPLNPLDSNRVVSLNLNVEEEVQKLRKSDLESIYKKMKADSLKHCDNLVRKFVDCSKSHTLFVVWSCKSELEEMNACTKLFNDQKLHEYKIDFIKERHLRRVEKAKEELNKEHLA